MQRPSENYDTLRLRMIRARLLKGHLCPTAPFERRKQLRDLRDAGAASQGVQVGLPDAFEGFEEDGGQDDGSNAGNGPQDFDGASAFHRAEPAMPTRPLPGMDATANSIIASVNACDFARCHDGALLSTLFPKNPASQTPSKHDLGLYRFCAVRGAFERLNRIINSEGLGD